MNKCLCYATLLALAGCDSAQLASGAAGALEELSPLPASPRADATNAYADHPTAARLGQMLFFDKDLSGAITQGSTLGAPGTTDAVNCAVCHTPEAWFYDINKSRTPMGLGGREEVNNLSIVNVGFNKWTMWEGGADSYWSQAMEDLEGALDGSRLELAHILYDNYREEYNEVFPEPLPEALAADHPEADRFPASGRPMNFWEDAGEDPGPYESMTAEDQEIVTRILVNYGKAVQAYERVLMSRNAPFDKYMAGDDQAISDSAQRGAGLFVGKAGCVECHAGPNFSDDDFHNITVPAMGSVEWGVPDEDSLGYYDGVDGFLNGPFATFNTNTKWSDSTSTGRIADVRIEDKWKYTMRTQSLRHVAETPPYMHSGQFETLRQVVEFYNDGGAEEGTYAGVKDEKIVELNLTDPEIDDIVEFLKTLTGERVSDELIRDTSRSPAK